MSAAQEYAMSGRLDNTRVVGSVEELLTALRSSGVREVQVTRNLDQVPSLRLQPGQILRGSRETPPFLSFLPGSDGIELTADNHLLHLRLFVEPQYFAIKNKGESDSFGRLLLEGVETTGRVSIIVAAQQGKAHLEVRGLHIEAADASQELDQPTGYGVSVVQGAFTLWNKRPSSAGQMTADLLDISVGRLDAPVRGSGIFVCGASHTDMSLRVQRLRAKAVYSHGCIAAGIADRISGGVFVVHGAVVDLVDSGPVTTFGPNDMALDNWGAVERWIAHEKVTTFGESAIGFVNFGQLDFLSVLAPIETHGTGARGFNVYSGTVRRAEFDRIETHGDGAIAVQISQPVGAIHVRRGIETYGSKGKSLVKGVIQELVAIGLSLRPGGSANDIQIYGGLRTHGPDVPPLEQAGEIGSLVIQDGFGNKGKESHAQNRSEK